VNAGVERWIRWTTIGCVALIAGTVPGRQEAYFARRLLALG
jgi:hypothetical protein